jgi:hypothetical protein
MAEQGKEEALFKRVEALGLRLDYDAGFSIVARSASAQQPDGDDAEIEQAVIEQMGKYVRQISTLAAGRARGVRGNDFLGEQVFIPSIRVFGRLRSVSQDGDVTVSYRRESFKAADEVVDVTHSGSGADLLLILSEEGPAAASETSFTWIVDERLRRLFARAGEVGLRLEHFSGFTLAKWRAVDGVEREVIEGIFRELGAKLREISDLTVARARGERGAHFVGRRVLVPAFFNAFGTIVSSSVDGKVTVRYRDKHVGSEQTCWCQGDDLLIVPDEVPAEPTSTESSEESGWRKLVRRVFGG